MAVFPLRAVYMPMDDGEQTTDDPSVVCDSRFSRECPPLQVLISVPKRRLHHAIDRNRVKRQVREAYRRHKQTLWERLEQQNRRLAIAFIYIGDAPSSSSQITRSVCKILHRIEEKL